MIAARRINQLTYRTANEIQGVAPGIIKGAIEEVYKTPFQLLGQFGTKKYKQIKKKLFFKKNFFTNEKEKTKKGCKMKLIFFIFVTILMLYPIYCTGGGSWSEGKNFYLTNSPLRKNR